MLKDIRIVLIGAGNIGSRYLQGLAKLNFNAEITVLDISTKSLEISKNMIKDIKNTNSIRYNFINSFNKISGDFEIAIISTTSRNRLGVIKQLNEKSKIKYWILEKVLVQSLKDLRILDNIFLSYKKVWVNHSRRLMNWHKKIRDKIVNEYNNDFEVQIEGSEWGLACNGLHFIDLISWWTNSSIEGINTSGLKEWLPSKRQGFEEIYGTLKINFKRSKLTLICEQGSESLSIIKIKTNKGFIQINENKGTALFGEDYPINGSLDYLSNLVPELISKIIYEGSCTLPNLKHSIDLHEKFIESLAKHRFNNLDLDSQIIPIT